jgi:protein O-mannosyl-transferase
MKGIRAIRSHKEYIFSFRNWGPLVLLALVTLACYANSLQNGFVSDDHVIIEMNRETLGFKTFFSSLVSTDYVYENTQTLYYRPLTRLSYLVDAYFFDVNPAGFHTVNITLHIICTVLIYFTLLRLGHRQSVSLCAALLFGIHPINSETVNFISSRNNILTAIFVLMSLLAFLGAEKQGEKVGYFLSAIFFFLAMLSKETGVMLFPFLIVYKIYQELKKHEGRNPFQWDMSYILYHVLFLATYLFLRYIAIDGNYIYGHMSGLGARLKQLLYIIPTYSSLLVAPVKITWPHYIPKNFSGLNFPLTLWWSGLIIILFYITLTTNKNSKLWLAWAVINFIPASNFVPIPSLPMSERYLYLPVIGIFALAIEMLFSSAARIGIKKLHLIAFACLILIFGIRTFYRNFDWHDDQSLVRSSVKADPASARNHFFYGLGLYHDGRNEESRKEFEEALTLDPAFDCASWAYYYLGTINMETRRFDESKRCFVNSSNLGNSAAQYIISLFFPEKRKDGKSQEGGMTHPMITMNAIPFIPEVNERMKRSHSTFRRSVEIFRNQHQRTFVNSSYQHDKWKPFYRFSTGTELYYDPVVRKKGNDVTISTRYFLGRSDRVAFALRLLKFPLVPAVEARFIFDVNCLQKVYSTSYMEFRDDHGNELGTIYPQKEEYILSEYLFPGTVMRSLSDAICREQFP